MANKPGSWKTFKNIYIKKMTKDGSANCYYCGIELVESIHPPVHNSITIDHIVPLSEGGKLKDYDNIRLCCFKCNQIKANVTLKEEINVKVK